MAVLKNLRQLPTVKLIHKAQEALHNLALLFLPTSLPITHINYNFVPFPAGTATSFSPLLLISFFKPSLTPQLIILAFKLPRYSILTY